MDLENMLSKISQTENCKYCMMKNLEYTHSLRQKVEKKGENCYLMDTEFMLGCKKC